MAVMAQLFKITQSLKINMLGGYREEFHTLIRMPRNRGAIRTPNRAPQNHIIGQSLSAIKSVAHK